MSDTLEPRVKDENQHEARSVPLGPTHEMQHAAKIDM